MAVSENNKRVIVTLPKEIYTKLEELAKEERRSISNMGSIILIKHFESMEAK